MAYSIDSVHETSDALTDPYCDLCFVIKGLNIRVSGFCRECVQFLCWQCQAVHTQLQASRHHDVVQGDDMPKSQADKPPRFDFCDVHPKQLKDEFCCDHRSLLCTICASSEHKECSIKPVKDACTTVDASETSALYGKIQGLQETLKSSLISIDNELRKMKDQEKTMLQDVQQVYDQITAKVNKMFDSIKNEIQTSCQSQIDLLSRHQKKVNVLSQKLDSLLSDVGVLKAKSIDTKIFLRLQETVSYTTKFTMEFQESRKSLQFASLSCLQSKAVEEILSSSFTFGTVRKSDSKPPEADMLIPEIHFPVSVLNQTTAGPGAGQTASPQTLQGAVAKPLISRPTQPLSKIKATKTRTYNIILKNDAGTCYITGMAITKDRRLLTTDICNNKVKMFSHDMKFLSSVTVSDSPRDIAVINEREAVVTTANNNSLVILYISGSQLSIKTTTPLSYDVGGISRYYDKLVVTSPYSKPSSVKLIDQTGRVYWSLSSDQQGQPLFRWPRYVSSPGAGRSSTVIVTDSGNHTLTLLNGDTGNVITRRQLKGKYPSGVTADSAGNFYVCYRGTSEVAVLSGNLSEEKILLSAKDGLGDLPRIIVCDDEAHQLTIFYCGQYNSGCDDIDSFQLS